MTLVRFCGGRNVSVTGHEIDEAFEKYAQKTAESQGAAEKTAVN